MDLFYWICIIIPNMFLYTVSYFNFHSLDLYDTLNEFSGGQFQPPVGGVSPANLTFLNGSELPCLLYGDVWEHV